jgi:hypothetical protein
MPAPYFVSTSENQTERAAAFDGGEFAAGDAAEAARFVINYGA